MTELNLINEDKFIIFNNEKYISAEDIGIYLEYKDPAKAILRIYNRNKDTLDGHTALIKVQVKHQKYFKRYFTKEGFYLIGMISNQKKSPEFRRALASYIKEERIAGNFNPFTKKEKITFKEKFYNLLHKIFSFFKHKDITPLFLRACETGEESKNKN